MKVNGVPLVRVEVDAEHGPVGGDADGSSDMLVYGDPVGRVNVGVDVPSVVTLNAGVALQPKDTPPLDPIATEPGWGTSVVQFAVTTCSVAGTAGKVCIIIVDP